MKKHRLPVLFLSLTLTFIFASDLFAMQTPVGAIRTVTGDVKIKSKDAKERTPKIGDNVFVGDLVKTGKDGKIKILFTNDNILVLGYETSITIDELASNPETKDSQSIFTLLTGKVRAIVKKLLTPNSQFKIKTANSDIGVLGTIFVVTYDEKTGKLIIFSESGQILIASNLNKWDPLKLLESFYTIIEKEGAPGEAKPLKGYENFEPLRDELTVYEDIKPKQPDDVKNYLEGNTPEGEGAAEGEDQSVQPEQPDTTVPPIQQEPLTGKVKVKVITNFP
jgi:hypothetical protein